MAEPVAAVGAPPWANRSGPRPSRNHEAGYLLLFLPGCGGNGGPTALTDTLCGIEPGTTLVTFEDANLAAAIRAALALGAQGDLTCDVITRLTVLDASAAGITSLAGIENLTGLTSLVAADPSRAIIARYARGDDYHDVVEGKLHELLAWLDSGVEGGVRGRAYVDTGPILERDLAQRAGLGWFGRNTMLINPSRGSYFFLGMLLVDLELPPSEPFVEDRCGSCHACLEACPTGALLGRDEDGDMRLG